MNAVALPRTDTLHACVGRALLHADSCLKELHGAMTGKANERERLLLKPQVAALVRQMAELRDIEKALAMDGLR